MKMKLHRILAALILLIFNGCGVSQMNVYNGKFQAIKSPNIHGNQRYLEPGKNTKISIEGNYADNHSIALNGITNQSISGEEFTLPESTANLTYRLISTTGGINLSVVNKKEVCFYGLGLGGQPFPYLYGITGLNNEFFEIGASMLLGISNDKATYSGEAIWTENQLDGSWEERSDISEKDNYILHTYTSASLYSSLYVNGFSINYVGTIGWPWGFLDELPAVTSNKETRDFDISFNFPYLLMNDISLGYQYQSVFFQIGYNQIVGKYFDGKYSSVSGSIGYNY